MQIFDKWFLSAFATPYKAGCIAAVDIINSKTGVVQTSQEIIWINTAITQKQKEFQSDLT